jgi:hypothetical protein
MENDLQPSPLTLASPKPSPETMIVLAINELTSELKLLREEVSEMRKKMPSAMEG